MSPKESSDPTPAGPSITDLLQSAGRGDPEATDLFARLVYDELRSLAASYLRRERPDHTLQPTALVNELFLRLPNASTMSWRDRAHFFGVAAQVMRRVLVDHARAAQTTKRNGGRPVTLDDALIADGRGSLEVISVHEALEALAAIDSRQARIVELRFFVGLTLDETAEVIGISPATVSREWTLARAWLHRELSSA